MMIAVALPHYVLVQRVGWVLLHSLWQGAAVSLILAGGLWLARRRSANLRYVLGCTALAAMLVLPLGTFLWVAPAAPLPPTAATVIKSRSLPATAPGQGNSPRAGSRAPQPTAETTAIELIEPGRIPAGFDAFAAEGDATPETPWRERLAEGLKPYLPEIVAAYMVGVLAFSWWQLAGHFRLRRIRSRGVQTASEAVSRVAGELVLRLRVQRGIDVLQSVAIQVPVVVGLLQPAILLPVQAVTGLTAAQLRAILAHEIAHLRRYDHLVNAVQCLVETLLFYHPCVWWVSRRIRHERELCCDELVVGVGIEPVVYARALALVARLAKRPTRKVAATGGVLETRVVRILNLSARSGRSGWLIPAVLTTFGLTLLLGALWLPEAQASALDEELEAARAPLKAYDQPVERMLHAPGSNRASVLDLDTGVAWRLPAGMDPKVDPDRVRRWAEQYAVDLIRKETDATVQGHRLRGVWLRKRASFASADAELVRRVLAEGPLVPFGPVDVAEGWGRVFAFETASGSRGVLEFTDAPWQGEWVRLRYKLLRAGGNQRVLDDPKPLAPARLTPAEAVVLDPASQWIPCNWAGRRSTELAAREQTDGVQRFRTWQPGRGHAWYYPIKLPIDFERYPVAVLTYRARNLSTSPGEPVIWVDDGTGSEYGNVWPFRGPQIVADGRLREVRMDVRALRNPPQGPIRALCVYCFAAPHEGVTVNRPAELDVVGIRFEVDPDAEPTPIDHGAPVAVTVTDEREKPLANANVTVHAERLNWARTVATDMSGQAKLTPLETFDGSHEIRVSASGFADRRIAYRGDKHPATVALRPAGRYGGMVQDASGRGVADATVTLAFPRTDGRGKYRNVRLVRTDSQGRWHAGGLPAGQDDVAVRVAHHELSDDVVYRELDAEATTQLRRGDCVLTMHPGRTITGTVLRPDETPIAGAQVKLGRDCETQYTTYPRTFSDAEGRFRFDDVPPGLGTVIVEARRFAPLSLNIADEGNQELTARVQPGRPLRGVFVTRDGTRVGGVRIAARVWRGGWCLDWSARSDAMGQFEWSDAPAEPVQYDITRRGYQPIDRLELNATGEIHWITLEPEAAASDDDASR